MITNTELLYTKAKQFQDKRTQLMTDYETKVQNLERFKGSQGYEEDLKKLTDKHNSDLSALIEEYRPSFDTIFGGMMDAIGKRTLSAPTNEQVNLLNVLRMKKKVTLEECQRMAESVKDNPIALSLVTEIAQEHGIMQSFDGLCPEMSSQKASDIVTDMREGLEDYLQYDTTKASRRAKAYHEEHYGHTDSQLTKRTPFNDMDSFYRGEMGFSPETLKQFSDIVDA